ncbi:Armadillo-type fold [Pseudocohnilembus persalinus]|uniref:Armadillo-type fold n=1 Tax=Pseudocohnilembus persalinus TaxID=266149 RepID=A0A0V0QLW2_PSEPJ|nr:Armadillo-type fold [Pseudocohnilembus persalinus]|eukprot:KRX03213.1 Armadillo-type fold [Pseudocohnilembus persalinus]
MQNQNQTNQEQQQIQQEPLEYNKLKVCIEYIHNPPSEKSRQDANNFLLESERHKDFPLVMLQIFENESNYATKHSAFFAVKNYIQRYWKQQMKKFSNTISISGETKLIIKKKHVEYLSQINDKAFRKQLDDSICHIVANDFPHHYQEIYEYIINNLKNIQQQLQNGQLSVLAEQVTKNFLKSTQKVLKQQSKKRLGSTRQMFYNIVQSIMESVLYIWETVYSGFNNSLQNGNQSEIQGYLQLAKQLDKIIIYTVLCSSNDVHTDERVGQIITKFLLQCQKLLQLRQNTKDEDTKEGCNKELKVVIYGLSLIQQTFPFCLIANFNDYLQLLQIIISQSQCDEEDLVLKVSLLSFMKILKCFVYYSDSDTYLMTLKKDQKEILQPVQQKLNQIFYGFFSETNIQSILETFITKLFPRVISDALTEEIIEQEDETYFDQTLDEMENSIYNILMVVVDNLLIRFPKVTLTLLKQLVDNLISNNFQTYSMDVKEGLFAMLGLVPRVCEKNQIDPNNMILTESNQPVVIYESCMCLKNILKNSDLDIDFSQLIDKVVPIIIKLFQSFQQSTVLWNLVYLLSYLLEKSMYNASSNVLQSFQTTDLNNLIKTDSDLLKNAFVDMFRNVLVSFPPNSNIKSIIALIINFISYSLQQAQQNPNKGIDASMLSLWYLLAKEYSPENHQMDNEMKQLIQVYIPFISENNESDIQIICDSLYILEEYVMLNFIPISDYPSIIQLIEQKYKYAQVLTSQNDQLYYENQNGAKHYINSEDNDIKVSCLNITTTLLLIYMNQGQSDSIQKFSFILKLALNDLIHPYNNTQQGVSGMRSAIQSLINRFLIKYPEDILAYINSIGINNEQFFQAWIQNMTNLSSKNQLRINSVTLLKILPNLGQNVFTQNLDTILKKIIPDIVNYIEHKQNPQLKEIEEKRKQQNKPIFGKRRMTDGEPSQRKEQLRNTQLFEDLNLLQIFQQQFKSCFQQYNIGDNLQQILGDQNGGLYNQLVQLMSQS